MKLLMRFNKHLPMRNKFIKCIDIDRTFNLKTRPNSDAPECSSLHSIKDTSVVYMPHSQRLSHRITAEFAKKCMSNNIRNKGTFEIKIAKIAQNLQKFDILQI